MSVKLFDDVCGYFILFFKPTVGAGLSASATPTTHFRVHQATSARVSWRMDNFIKNINVWFQLIAELIDVVDRYNPR